MVDARSTPDGSSASALRSIRGRTGWQGSTEWRGGFPEHAEFAEDTLFDEQMLAAGFRPIFTPEATVGWKPPSGFGGLARTTFRWGRGDGAARLRGSYYKRTLAAYAATAALAVVLATTKPKTLPLLAVPVAIAIWNSIRFKLRHEASPLKYIYLPVARVTATTSNLAGYLFGRYVGE
jgi:hypothetical protein